MFPQFGTDGVRGVANIDVTPDVAQAIGRAAAEFLGGTRVIIGRDTRRSGPMLEAGLVAGYTACGVDVDLLGVVPSPTVSWFAAQDQVAGVMITASHNPFADNGIKLFAPGGLKLTDSVESAIQTRFHELLGSINVTGPTGEAIGGVRQAVDTSGWVESVVGTVVPNALAGLHIAVDAANGSASLLGPQVLRELGAKVTVIANQPDGININANCGSTHPAALQALVGDVGADFGLAFDGDADRLVAVSGEGDIISGDHILAILARDWASAGKLVDNTVVVTVMSNLGFHRSMSESGIDVVTTDVGDRYVLEALNAGGFSLGGEQSGHVICRDLASTGDGVLAGVQLAVAVVRSGRQLGQLASEAMTTIPQLLRNVVLPERDDTLVARMADAVSEVEAGLGTDGRVLVRASGTEPLLRVMVEHLDDDKAESICAQLVAEAERLIAAS